jgi:hypothetical protein
MREQWMFRSVGRRHDSQMCGHTLREQKWFVRDHFPDGINPEIINPKHKWFTFETSFVHHRHNKPTNATHIYYEQEERNMLPARQLPKIRFICGNIYFVLLRKKFNEGFRFVCQPSFVQSTTRPTLLPVSQQLISPKWYFMCWAALVYWIKITQNPLLARSSKLIIRPKTNM